MSGEKRSYSEFEAVLGHRFHNTELLTEALTHRSALSGHISSAQGSYQRLEFLGDRVLAVIIAEMLHSAFPSAEEGELARRLTGLVRNETCADVARSCRMGSYLRLGEGEKQAGGRENDAILGDACEAVIAAIYLDGGLDAARHFIERNWKDRMLSWSKPLRDPKTTLQEWAHSLRLPTPVYNEVARSGPDHALNFVMEVSVEGYPPSTGKGGSKRIAQQRAASTMLVREGVWDHDEEGGDV
ncbi:MAG: ribonuclease III [Pseudomonadota bacterium]